MINVTKVSELSVTTNYNLDNVFAIFLTYVISQFLLVCKDFAYFTKFGFVFVF